jgi:hypothetical protein
MTAFLSGAAGALAVLFLAVLLRRALWRRWRGRAPGARHVLRRIGARPEQERALLAEVEAVTDVLRALRGDAGTLRGELADLIAGPEAAPARVAAALDARLARLGELRSRFAEAVSRVHSALDPAQRQRLAELVRFGPHRAGCGHRHGAHA